MSLSEEWLSTDALRDVAAEPVILRPYQTDAIARIDDSISRGVRRIMVQPSS
jgi:type I site-specific restriction endonuclease